MGRISGLRRFLKLPSRKRSVFEDADEEIRFHIERKTERLVSQGYADNEARAEARRKFGNFQESAKVGAQSWIQSREGMAGFH